MVPRGCEKLAEVCQPDAGTEFDVVCAYLRVPPLPLLDKFTVAVTFAAEALLFVTLEIVGAVIDADAIRFM